jgi:hypothetical protein
MHGGVEEVDEATMNTPGLNFLPESLKEFRAAIKELRAESHPLSPSLRQWLNIVLDAEQYVLTQIEVQQQRINAYNSVEIDIEAEECAELLAVARQARTNIREERLSLKTNTRVAAQQNTIPAPPNSPESDTFSPSDDYRSLRFKRTNYVTTRYQAIMIRVLHEAYIAGYPDVGATKLLSAVGNETSDVRNTFKNSPLWNTLVVGKRKGTYRLNLPEN